LGVVNRSRPCIDAGDDAWLDWEEINGDDFDEVLKYDFEGDPRPYGADWDIGVDEWRP